MAAPNLQAVVARTILPAGAGSVAKPVKTVEERAATSQRNQKKLIDEGVQFVGHEVPIRLESEYLHGDLYFVDPATLSVYRYPQGTDLPAEVIADNYVGRLFPGYHVHGGLPLLRVAGVKEDDEFMAKHPRLDEWYARGEVNLWGFPWETWLHFTRAEKEAHGFVEDPDWAGIYKQFKAMQASGRSLVEGAAAEGRELEELSAEKVQLRIPQKMKLTENILRKHFLKRALALHPDKNVGKDTTEAFKKVKAAYDALLEALRK